MERKGGIERKDETGRKTSKNNAKHERKRKRNLIIKCEKNKTRKETLTVLNKHLRFKILKCDVIYE
jgi:hypothetical protein